MPVGRCIVLSFAALLASGMPASAQVEPGQWVGDSYLVDQPRSTTPLTPSKHLIDERNRIKRTIPHIADAVDFPVPPSYRTMMTRSFWHNDALYAITAGGSRLDETLEDGSKVTLWTLAKWREDNGWQFVGSYRAGTKSLLLAIPCDNDRFIIVTSGTDLTSSKNVSQWSPFHRMTLATEKKELRWSAAIDHGMDDIRKHMPDSDFLAMVFNSRVAVTDDYAVLVNRETGLYWVFSLEKATLRHSGNIFKSVTPEMIAKGGFPHAILSVHPEKNGTILVSAQEESAFMSETGDAIKEAQEMRGKNPDMSVKDIHKVMELREEELADRSPLLVWYRIDPEKGKAERLGVPPVGAAYIREGTKNDYWRPMPDGSVRMGLLDSFLVDDSKQQESKKTADANGKQRDGGKPQEKSEKPSNPDKQQAAAPEPPK
jgi:hypothetical protein